MKTGDLVKVKGNPEYSDYGKIGIVQWVRKEYPPSVCVVMKGDTAIYAPCHLEVVNENR